MRNCRHCAGKVPPQPAAGRPRVFCSYDCKNAYHDAIGREVDRKRRAARRETGKACGICGTHFQLLVGTEKYCSKTCAREAGRLRELANERECVICGETYQPVNGGQRTCGVECAAARRASLGKKLCSRVRSGIHRAIGQKKAGRKWESLVGYTLMDLMVRVASQFKPGMGWHNIGEWHIDHVRPLSSFDFSVDGDSVLREAWALSNLQPLWAVENLQKGRRYAVSTQTAHAQSDHRQQAA